jgi:hypothetical protein
MRVAELFTVTGIPEVQQRLRTMASVVTPLMAIALQQEGDAILEASQSLVPVQTRALQASGTVSDPEIRGFEARTQVRYGGPGEGFERTPSDYAAIVHEDTTMNHPRGGQSHYLSEPLFAATHGMLDRLADALRVGL